MKKVLIIANTYFQIITAINLKNTTLQNREVDIIITDISTDYDKIASNLKELDLFRQVQTANINHICYKTNKIEKYIKLINWKKTLNEFIEKEDYENYDVLMFFNYDVFTYCVYNKLYSINKDIICQRYEEGFCSYLYDFSHHIINKFNKYLSYFTNRERLENRISKYYFYNPDLVLFEHKYALEKIENLNKKNDKVVNILNKTFHYEHTLNEYTKKYIFFQESFFCDGKKMDDLELVLKIAGIVAKENILVKLHPRNKKDRFKEYGIATNKTIGIPWEIIQMNNDFSDKVFLTISSGSVLASKLYFNENIKTYLLFNCTKEKSDMVTEEYFQYLNRVNEKFGLDGFIIPENTNELINKLKEDKK